MRVAVINMGIGLKNGTPSIKMLGTGKHRGTTPIGNSRCAVLPLFRSVLSMILFSVYDQCLFQTGIQANKRKYCTGRRVQLTEHVAFSLSHGFTVCSFT